MVEAEEETKEEVFSPDEVASASPLDQISEGSKLYTEITENFVQEFSFYDKTLYEWATDLMIKIPNIGDLGEVKYRELLVQLLENIQIASNYHSLASSMVEAISGGNSIRRSDLITAIVNNYAKRNAKRPAAAVIEKMAESYLSNTVSAIIAAKIVKSFWKQRLDTLLEVRKILEQIGLSLHVEIKFTST